MVKTASNAGDPGWISGLEKSPGGRNGHPLQYSCLENPTYRGARGATVHGVNRVGHNWVTDKTSRAPPLCTSPEALPWLCSTSILALKRYRFLNPALGMYDSAGLGSSPRAMLSSTSDSDHQLKVRTTLPSTHLNIFMQPEHSNTALSEPTLHFLAWKKVF